MDIGTFGEALNNEVNKEVPYIKPQKYSNFSNRELTALVDIQALIYRL